MAKKGIYNEQPFRGRFKGNTEGRVTNKKVQANWDEVEWNTPQLCEVCMCRPCECPTEKGND